MRAVESSPGRKCKKTGNLLGVCLLSPRHASEWQTCVSVPLLRNPLQVVRHQGLGCGGCIFLFIIDDPDPDRQHTTHVIWIHSWFQMHALVWTWLWAIIVCWEGMVYVYVIVCVSVWATVCTCICVGDVLVAAKNVMDQPCVFQLQFGLCFDRWFLVWFSNFLFFWSITLISYKLFFVLRFLVPVHLSTFTINRSTVG